MNLASFQLNPIKELQEPCHRNNDLRFPDTKKDKGTFMVEEAHINSILSTGTAVNLNKKAAKRKAAEEALSKLKASGYKPKGKSLEEVLRSNHKQEAELLGFDEIPIKIDDMDNTRPDKLRLQAAEEGPSSSSHSSKEPTAHLGSEGKQHDEISEESKSLQEVLQSSSKQEAELLGFDEAPIKIDDMDNIQLEKLRLRAAEEGSSLASHCTSSRKTLSKEPPVHLGSQGTQHDEISEACKDSSNKQSPVSAKSHLYEICAANYWNRPSFVCYKEEGLDHIKLFTYKVIFEVEEDTTTMLECFSEPKMTKKAAAEHAAEGALWYLKHLGYLPKHSK